MTTGREPGVSVARHWNDRLLEAETMSKASGLPLEGFQSTVGYGDMRALVDAALQLEEHGAQIASLTGLARNTDLLLRRFATGEKDHVRDLEARLQKQITHNENQLTVIRQRRDQVERLERGLNELVIEKRKLRARVRELEALVSSGGLKLDPVKTGPIS